MLQTSSELGRGDEGKKENFTSAGNPFVPPFSSLSFIFPLFFRSARSDYRSNNRRGVTSRTAPRTSAFVINGLTREWLAACPRLRISILGFIGPRVPFSSSRLVLRRAAVFHRRRRARRPSFLPRFSEGVFVRFSLARHPRGELKQRGFSPGNLRFRSLPPTSFSHGFLPVGPSFQGKRTDRANDKGRENRVFLVLFLNRNRYTECSETVSELVNSISSLKLKRCFLRNARSDERIYYKRLIFV